MRHHTTTSRRTPRPRLLTPLAAVPLVAALTLALPAGAHADEPGHPARGTHDSQLVGLSQTGPEGTQQIGVLSTNERDGRRQTQLVGWQQSDGRGGQQQAGVLSSQSDGRGRSQAQLVGAQQTDRDGDQQQIGLLQTQHTDTGRQQQTGLLQSSTSGPRR